MDRIRLSLADARFRSYLAGRILAMGGFCVTPFIAMRYASAEAGGLSGATIVSAGAAMTFGMALGSLILGRLGGVRLSDAVMMLYIQLFAPVLAIQSIGAVLLQLNGATVATAPVVDAGAGTWNLHTASWMAGAGDAGKTLRIRLTSTGSQGDFDNVRMTSAVPEPSSYAMALAGLAVLGAIARRRREQ